MTSNFTSEPNQPEDRRISMNINEGDMSSDQSHHSARLIHGEEHPWEERQWEVSWLPGRRLTRNQAITAMVLSSALSTEEIRQQDRMWPFIQGWADELGVTADQAVTQIAGKPAWLPAAETAPERPDPEAGE
jgi:hypothetical protein